MVFRFRLIGRIGLKASIWRHCGQGAFLTLNEWNARYITSTYTPLWTTGSSGLRYAMLCRDVDQPILYEQGDIGYHTRRFASWRRRAETGRDKGSASRKSFT